MVSGMIDIKCKWYLGYVLWIIVFCSFFIINLSKSVLPVLYDFVPIDHINSYPLILYVSYNNIKNSREIFLKRINEQMKQMNNEILITIERVLIE